MIYTTTGGLSRYFSSLLGSSHVVYLYIQPAEDTFNISVAPQIKPLSLLILLPLISFQLISGTANHCSNRNCLSSDDAEPYRIKKSWFSCFWLKMWLQEEKKALTCALSVMVSACCALRSDRTSVGSLSQGSWTPGPPIKKNSNQVLTQTGDGNILKPCLIPFKRKTHWNHLILLWTIWSQH